MLFGLRCLLVLFIGIAPVQAQPLAAPELITAKQGLPQAFVPSIVQDKQGFIWMATRDGLCRYDGNGFKVFQPANNGTPALSSAQITKMALDRQGKIWIGSETGDLDLFDPARETFVNVSHQSFYRQNTSPYTVESIYVDSRNRLWLCTRGQGLTCLDLPKRQIHRYRRQTGKAATIGSDSIRSVIEDRVNKDILWIATYTGLERFDQRTGQFSQYRHQAGNATSLPDTDALKELYQLPNGHVFIRSTGYVSLFDPRTGGVLRAYALPGQEEWWRWAPIVADRKQAVYFSRLNRLFRFTESEGPRLVAQSPDALTIQSLFIDRSDVLWVGTNGGGVFKYNLKAATFRAAPYQISFYSDVLTGQLGIPAAQLPKLPASHSYLFRSTTDSTGKLWYNLCTSPFYRFDPVTKQLTLIRFPVRFSTKFPEFPAPLATDPQGRIWAVYDSLAMWYNERVDQWIRFPHPLPHPRGSNGWVAVEFVVDERALWIATHAKGLVRVDRKTGAIHHYAHQPNDSSSLSNDNLFCVSADPADSTILWIGTFGSGLCRFDKRTGWCRRLTTADGLPNNVIYAAMPDRYGALWIATNQGLGRMNRRTFRTRIYTQEDGLAGDEFNRHHYLRLPNGRLVLGGLEGITSFDPGNIEEDTYQPPVQITSVQINNRPMPPGEGPAQLLSQLTLPHDKNYVTVQFAAMQYNRHSKLRYRYQLEGLEENWTETDRPLAVYTDLKPGQYTLRLNAANTAGAWSPHIRTLTLTIKPPLWATWWAYVGYGLVIGSLIFGLVQAWANRLKLRQSMVLKQKEVELNQQEAEQLRANDAMKTRFFANITHEFRTPLTLILGPAEQMVSENLEPRNRRRLVTIEQNAHQLLRLINQLLDLSKLEASVMPIHESRGDLTECIRHWLQPLGEQARAQGLTLTFTSEVTGTHQFDTEKLERIVYNLTANALKFTQTGVIAVSLTASPEGITLTIADTGIGIAPQHLPHIFDRFYQVAEIDKELDWSGETQHTGTGIGLALVNELVQLQLGRIAVDSTLNKGTTFTVELPYRQVTLADDTLDLAAPSGLDADAWTSADELDEPRLLIVEDNDELARFIAESLPEHYRIRRAANGRDGLELALEHAPDLIISDVMMPVQPSVGPTGTIQSGPEMDGFALCSSLKADLRTSHIPVILLTAKVAAEDRLEGLTQGADDYLTKPFQVAELQLRVRNQLLSKRRQREWVRASLLNPDEAQPDPQPVDPFLTRLYELMEAHLDETNFGLEHMMTELGVSRSNLFRKVKALTDLSATDLLRQYRLKRGAHLLRAGHSVSDTAYRVGFESPPYFAKCFRDVYQLTPSQFAAQV